MRVMVGLSVATGLPWEYFGRQDDQVVSTYLDILKKARGGKRAAGAGEPAGAMTRAPKMSG